MSLLNVTVKKASFVGVQAQQFNTYVTLKLQNVKSTTVTVKGANPCWEQDFLFETNDVNTGLLVEVWSKGMLWDRALGYHYIPLPEVSYANEDDCGQWVSLDSELEMRGGEVVATKSPTGHSLLIACRFEQPFDPENTEAADLQRKLEMLNNTMDQEARAEQARRQILYNIGHSGYSEDSDYTSDLNYPVGGQGANSSASQFRSAANQLATPQRSLETSRENSYERDDHQIPATVGGRLAAGTYGHGGRGHSPRYDEPYPGEGPPQRYTTQPNESSEPLFYNSRPRHYKEYRRRKHTWDYEDSQDGWYSEGYDYQGTRIDDTRIYSDTEYYPTTTTTSSKKRGTHRRPSLERQTTLYDEQTHYGTDTYSGNDGLIGKMSAIYPECQTDIRHNDYYDSITGYMYQDGRFGQDDEDRQWDSGGKWYSGSSTYNENKRNRKSLPQRPASSIGIHRPDYKQTVTRQRSYESEELDYGGQNSRWRNKLQPQQRPMSRQEGGTGKKLPPTPMKPSNVMLGRKPISLPATPGRQLPRNRITSNESYYKQDYNEDYNYAYCSSQDNLQDGFIESGYQDTNIIDPLVNRRSYTNGENKQYPGTVHVQDNQFVPDYVEEITKEYSQDYEVPQTQDTFHANQTYVENSYTNDYQQSYTGQLPPTTETIYHDTYQANTYPKVSESIDQFDNSRGMIIDENYHQSVNYNQNTNESYQDGYNKQDSYTDSFKQDSYPNSYKQDSFGDSYKQDSFPDSYKQDSFPDSYTDSYKDEIYQENYKDDNNKQEQYDDYNGVSLVTSSYDQKIATSVYDQQIKTSIYDQYSSQNHHQYDNNYDVTTSTYQQQPYIENHDQSVPVSKQQNNYQESHEMNIANQNRIAVTESEYSEFHVEYNKEESMTIDYKNGYSQDYHEEYSENYEDNYHDSYQNSFDDQYKNNGTTIVERRKSEVPELSVTTPRGQTRTNGYPSSESEYFYPNHDEQTQITPLSSSRRKRLGKRDASPLLQQNTDSLESRDDELKDSFETAKGFSEYSTAGESSPIQQVLIDSPQNSIQPAVTIINHNSIDHVPTCITTTAMVHTGGIIMPNGKRSLTRTESYIEDTIMDDEYPEILPTELERKDSQLSHQSQIINNQHSQKPKLTRGDSYISDHYGDETYDSRRESFQQVNTTKRDSYGSVLAGDSFKPPLNRTDSYQKRELTRGSSVYGQNYTTPQPISREESYQRGHFNEQDSIDETEIVLSNAINGEYKMRDETLERYERGEEALARGSRENSLVEPYKGSPPMTSSGSPRGSITKQTSLDESVQMDTPPRSPPEPPADEELMELVGVQPVPTQLKDRPEMTAKQRWHWAYNKIIMQLNVSN